VNAAGAGNWQSTRGDDGEGGFAVMRRYGIANISVSEGAVRYGTPAGERFAADSIDLALNLPADDPLMLEGDLMWRGEEFSLEAEITDPDSLFADGASGAQIGFGSDVGGLRFAGRINLNGRSDGTLRLSSYSLRDAFRLAGVELPAPPNFENSEEVFGNFDFEGGVMADAQKIMLTGIRLRLERADVQGVLSVDRSGAVPMVEGELGIRRLNVDSFLRTRAEADDEPAEVDEPPADTQPFRLGFLKQANARLALNLRSIVAQNVLIDEADVGLTLTDGLLVADMRNLEIADGNGEARVEIDARGEVPVFKETLSLERVRMYSLLNDLVQVDRLDGDGALTLELTARGDNRRALLSSLAGTGKISVTGGMLRGANLIGVARVLRGLITTETMQSALGETRGTDFGELSASFTVADGVARTTDLSLTHSSFRMTGNGVVDLANRTLDMRFEPRTPANTRLALPDLGIPFKVQGPWANLTYLPDFARMPAGLVRELTERPLRAIQDPRGALESLFGR
jgi:AsmA protein